MVFLVFLSAFDLSRVFGSFGLKKNESLWLFEDFWFFEENSDFLLSQFRPPLHMSSWNIYRGSDLLIKCGKLGQEWLKKGQFEIFAKMRFF